MSSFGVRLWFPGLLFLSVLGWSTISSPTNETVHDDMRVHCEIGQGRGAYETAFMYSKVASFQF